MDTFICAFSGGKDSTAMALGLAETGVDFKLLFTPTGNELPELYTHLIKIAQMTGKELIIPKGPSLDTLIRDQNFLPSWHSRWCTRMIKIVPCITYLKRNPGCTLLVGLRYDEEARIGLYGEFAKYRYPLREWEFTEADVLQFVEDRQITIPKRTDCALCPYQRIGEWYRLWKLNPEHYQQGIAYEKLTGATERSPSAKPRKDGTLRWAVSLEGLAEQFKAGDKPSTLDENNEEAKRSCRVCRL